MNGTVLLLICIFVVILLAVPLSLRFLKREETLKIRLLKKDGQRRKIAIVYFGLLRSLKDVYETHSKHIFRVLQDNDVDYKIFMHTWKTKGDVQKVWYSSDGYEKQDYSQYKVLNPYKYKIDSQEEFQNTLELKNYWKEGEWDKRLLQNHLCAVESQKRGLKMVLEDNDSFDHVMFVRPDANFEKDFPIDALEFLESRNNGILIPNHHNNEGYNDRFAVTNMSHAKFYANRIDEYPAFNGRIVAEKSVKYIVKKYFRYKGIRFPFKFKRPPKKKLIK